MAKRKSAAQIKADVDHALRKKPKLVTVNVYSRPSGYWYPEARDVATGEQFTGATGYSREGALRELRGKFALIGVTIKSITDWDPYSGLGE